MRWFRRKDQRASEPSWRVTPTPDGLSYVPDGTGGIAASVIESALVQWADAGYAIERDAAWEVPWDGLYALLSDPDVLAHATSFGIPPYAKLCPRLVSRGSITDSDFTIAIAGWVDEQGRDVPDVRLVGAVANYASRTGLLLEGTWALSRRVSEFARRPQENRTADDHRRAWGEIRRLALSADARLDDFLFRTIILSPDRLRIGLRRSASAGASDVVEVVPGFDGCPEEWLSAFDSQSAVRDRYDLPTANGIVQIVVKPDVRTVLEQIKRMPGRRVAGARAEAFVTNPFAALGEAAANVIDAEEFEAERERAGLIFDRFTAYVDRDAVGTPVELGLLIESGLGPESRSQRYPLQPDEAREFIASVRASAAENRQLCTWREFEFELLGNVLQELDILEQALAAGFSGPRARVDGTITRDAVYDLSMYSERVVGIGTEKPYISAYIARKDESSGWFPDNLLDVIELPPERPGGEPRYISLAPEHIREAERALREAQKHGESTVRIPGTHAPVPVRDLENVLNTFTRVHRDAAEGRLEEVIRDKSKRGPRKGLLIKPNIASVDYLEERREKLLDWSQQHEVPASLRPEVQLKQHQGHGLAWLQHLFRHSPEHCRGALLADDMGLGKTLQLLCLIAWAHEQYPQLEPALVVAPVALLENWREEVGKFFRPGTLRVAELYGGRIAQLRVPKQDIDEQLRKDGLVRFLRPGWRGDAHIVLTNYETLRDLEFSFAAEKWSILICDEAQRVKNPNALVTRAVKKQNARFRVACTGTPVENTLADLWCLFDFVQPGLLGALNEFARSYRRPIEAKTDEEQARVNELRELIRPQILRRLKSDVATDLPRKIQDTECKTLRLAPVQRSLYVQAVGQFGKRKEAGTAFPFKNALGLLHYLRLICTDPRPYGQSASLIEPIDSYRAKSPKLKWLLSTLRNIREREEKALIFCEFKDIQRLLRHYINLELNYAPDIINGDTAATSSSDLSRQKRIRAFQARPGFGVLILSPLAVGFGVNIQAANHVIHYTRTWNPAKEDQATDRAYRIGQEKDVYVYCPVVTAEDFKTFDAKLDELLEFKRSLATDMLNGSGTLGENDFDITEVIPDENRRVLRDRLWEEAETLASPAVLAALAVLRRQGMQAPVIGYEVMNDRGIVVAELEAAWPSERFAIVTDESQKMEISGWRINTAAEFLESQGADHVGRSDDLATSQ